MGVGCSVTPSPMLADDASLSSSTSALRVVLGVMEVDAVEVARQRMDELHLNCEALMRAYHFQQRLQRFSKVYLDRVNGATLLAQHPLNHDLFRSLDAVEHYTGPQHMVNLLFGLESMLYVEPTLDPTWSYLLDDEHGEYVTLGDVDGLARYVARWPKTHDAFMRRLDEVEDSDFDGGDRDTPCNGIISI